MAYHETNRREFLTQTASVAALTVASESSHGAEAPSPAGPATTPKAEATMQTYTYKRTDTCAVKLDVYTGAQAGPSRPILLTIHGGALIMGGRYPIQMDLFQPLLDKGFAVVSIDYRLAPETKLPEIIKDIQDAYRWIRENAGQFGGDTARIAVQGGSAGGYLTLMTGFCVQPRPKALVSYYGYGDIIGDWYSKPDPFYSTKPAVTKEDAMSAVGEGTPCGFPQGNRRGDFYLYCRQHGIWPDEVSGRSLKADPAWFKPYCPIQNVSAEYPPTLLAHGNDDTDVPYAQSAQMAEALKRAGVEHEFITLEGAGHGFSHAKPQDYKNVLTRTVEFLVKHLS